MCYFYTEACSKSLNGPKPHGPCHPQANGDSPHGKWTPRNLPLPLLLFFAFAFFGYSSCCCPPCAGLSRAAAVCSEGPALMVPLPLGERRGGRIRRRQKCRRRGRGRGWLSGRRGGSVTHVAAALEELRVGVDGGRVQAGRELRGKEAGAAGGGADTARSTGVVAFAPRTQPPPPPPAEQRPQGRQRHDREQEQQRLHGYRRYRHGRRLRI